MASPQFLSHKVLRWLSPFLMLWVWGSSAALSSIPFYRYPFWGQTGFYLLALLGWATALLGWECRPLFSVPLT